MTPSTPDPKAGRSTPGQARRAPIEQEMELKFPNFELLVTAMSANISTSGLFIQATEPAPVGTTLSFRFRIDDWSPIQGTARVIWTREQEEGSDRPAGMGVSFVDIDSQSRRMIRYLVDKHLETGGEPFDLGGYQSEGPAAFTSPRVPRSQSNRSLWIVGALLMAGVVGVGLWYQLTRTPVDEKEPPPSMVALEQTGSSKPVDESTGEDPSEAAASPGNRQAEEAIERLVQDWSKAWESGKADELLSFYAADFEPGGRETRAHWEARLKREMSSATFIRVAISALEISAPTASQGQASFYQSIRSDQRDETVRTSLDVVRLNDGWKILRQANSR